MTFQAVRALCALEKENSKIILNFPIFILLNKNLNFFLFKERFRHAVFRLPDDFVKGLFQVFVLFASLAFA